MPSDASAAEWEEYHWYTEHAALLVTTSKWAFLGIISGLCVGLGTRLFLAVLNWSVGAASRMDGPWFKSYDLLPLALPACVWLVRSFAPTAKGHGTEAVITAVHTRSGKIDLAVAPVKLVATVLTLAFGGSVGKEGPCAQIGASITSAFADALRLSDEDRRRLVICGIGAGFASVFGTPVSGAIFGIEVLYLGRIEYPVLFPCLVSGITAHLVCGVRAPVPVLANSLGHFSGAEVIGFSILSGVLFGLIALGLIEAMRRLGRDISKHARRPYLVAISGGTALAIIYHLFGGAYAGLGVQSIEGALRGEFGLLLSAFAIKIAVTSITLEAGGSGGIITPLFFIGATAGAAFARVFHLPVGMFAAFGFVAMVAAGTNTPIASSVMGMELLPPELGVYAALCACTAYLIVGHRSVYPSQWLGISKSAALDVALHAPIGDISREDIRIRRGTLSARVHHWGSRVVGGRRRRKRSPD